MILKKSNKESLLINEKKEIKIDKTINKCEISIKEIERLFVYVNDIKANKKKKK